MQAIAQADEPAVADDNLGDLRRLAAHISARAHALDATRGLYIAAGGVVFLMIALQIVPPEYGGRVLLDAMLVVMAAMFLAAALLFRRHLTIETARSLRVFLGIWVLAVVCATLWFAVGSPARAFMRLSALLFVISAYTDLRRVIKNQCAALAYAFPERLVADMECYAKSLIRQGENLGPDCFSFGVSLSTEHLAGRLDDGWGILTDSSRKKFRVITRDDVTVDPPGDIEPSKRYTTNIKVDGGSYRARISGFSWRRLADWAAQ